MSPTARTLKYFRDRGYVADVVECYNSFSKHRKDFIEIIDIIVFKDKVIGIQATTKGNARARLKKAKESGHLHAWLKVAGFWVMGWYKEGNRWRVAITEIFLDKLGDLHEQSIDTDENFNAAAAEAGAAS